MVNSYISELFKVKKNILLLLLLCHLEVIITMEKEVKKEEKLGVWGNFPGFVKRNFKKLAIPVVLGGAYLIYKGKEYMASDGGQLANQNYNQQAVQNYDQLIINGHDDQSMISESQKFKENYDILKQKQIIEAIPKIKKKQIIEWIEEENIENEKKSKIIKEKYKVQENALELFDKKYAPPIHIIKLIEKNKNHIIDLYNSAKKGSFASGAIKGAIKGIVIKGVKGGDNEVIERIINAERIRNYIKKYNLDMLSVPNKYIYKINGKRLLFTEEIERNLLLSNEKKLFDLIVIQQLTKIAEIGFTDWGDGFRNVIQSKNGKFVFIDMDNISFEGEDCLKRKFKLNIPVYSKAQYVCALMNQQEFMTNEAKEWISGRLNFLLKYYEEEYKEEYKKIRQAEENYYKAYLEKSYEERMNQDNYKFIPYFFNSPITFSTEYDDSEINFEEVKKQIKEEMK